MKRKVVLVTGASRGLGLAICKLLISKDRYHVIATARSGSLSRFANAGIVENDKIWVRQLDVLLKEQRDQLIKEIDEKLGGVDILINNAA